MDAYQLIPNISEFIAAILATIFFRKYSNSNERYFILFLWITFLVDAIGLYSRLEDISISWLYESYTFISFMFYFYWYYTILRFREFKRLAIIFASLFTIITILTYTINSLSGKGYAFVTGSVCLLLLTFFHFYQLLKSDEVLVVKHKLSFWISTALLLFYIGIIPLMLLSKYLGFKAMSYNLVLIILNIILYGCYSIGFIWTKKKYNHF
ncbi:hypothetical protein [Patiriisocius hiemis]|uniref:Uncharacterized protein n=1 Tax=Patiriisocius hiemis TaxID=3075604 RepID=A0ABU2YFK5_9FLAO|nr:hypothetical protein [Constantimarinum sp. W242]MDT0556547.1 hypothetical protein [Constantimarinum sp. W242]